MQAIEYANPGNRFADYVARALRAYQLYGPYAAAAGKGLRSALKGKNTAKTVYKEAKKAYNWFGNRTKTTGARSTISNKSVTVMPGYRRKRRRTFKRKKFSRKYKKRRTHRRKGLSRVRKQVRSLQQRTKHTIGRHVYRASGFNGYEANTGFCAYNDFYQFGYAQLEGALNNVRIYDEDLKDIQTVNLASPTYSRTMMCKELTTTVTVKNNYLTPVNGTLYLFIPKLDTDITPASAFLNGLNDLGGSASPFNLAMTRDLVYPSDSKQLMNLYSMKAWKCRLMPGEQITRSFRKKNIIWKPDLIDSHALNYQKKFGGHTWAFRMQGDLCHDSINGITEVSTAKCGVDTCVKIKMVWEYDAGTSVNSVAVQPGHETITNTPVTGVTNDSNTTFTKNTGDGS